MKNIIIYLLAACFAFFPLSTDAKKTTTSRSEAREKYLARNKKAEKNQSAKNKLTNDATRNSTKLASRYVKLAGTYINAENITQALEILKKADNSLVGKTGWDADYWRAATEEAYGMAFLKMKMPQEAKLHFEKALGEYKRLISMRNGSPEAVAELQSAIEYLENQNDYSMKSSAVAGIAQGSDVSNFDNMKLRDLPAALPQNTINLSLANNKFRDFPAGLSRLNSLKYLNLTANRISDARIDYSAMKNLVWLSLSDNRIKSLPAGISAMKNLEYLDLSQNRLKEIPADLTELKSLKVLNLSGNKIPFAAIKNLLQSMPNTNILHDEYIRQEEELPEDGF